MRHSAQTHSLTAQQLISFALLSTARFTRSVATSAMGHVQCMYSFLLSAPSGMLLCNCAHQHRRVPQLMDTITSVPDLAPSRKGTYTAQARRTNSSKAALSSGGVPPNTKTPKGREVAEVSEDTQCLRELQRCVSSHASSDFPLAYPRKFG